MEFAVLGERLHATKNDIPEASRSQTVPLLNQRLADCIDLQMQTKTAHWNVRGPSFIALHKLFDEINDAVESYADQIAERSVQLGGLAEGTVRIVARRSELHEYPMNATAQHRHVEALATALAAFGAQARHAIDQAEGAHDRVTADMFTEISRGMDKWLWLVEAHLDREA